ncbi:hypothetical protein F4553_002540 [Allocatelliglobosispora scoriae]|uniref:DUF3105 domain-containing protein n=1 Tax=Allocatelliglobosispora scoriae TaxID=643052 RepID=A0A841BQR2_9ACTN|nr:DUF3105 domain-containing protein [Allocatelliglobosispora scoriae]MBB5869161.1 hypothetical protein [Allocatelliglobosispora scoriae]
MATARKPQPPRKPIKVGDDHTFRWVVIALVAILAIGTGIGVWATTRGDGSTDPTVSAPPTAGADWAAQAAAIPGIVDDRSKNFTANHVTGPVAYANTPPIGGDHNPVWQNCMGDVYDGRIANENAVHSLEHGAVWITYEPGLAADQREVLASKVRGVPYTMMSRYPDQGSKISLQAWSWQLKVDDADDPRIDGFIRTLRINASQEPGAACSGGVTKVL